MVVHAVAALMPLAAVAYVFRATGANWYGLNATVLEFVLRASLLAVLGIAVPSTVTGVLERNRMYATWHQTHRIKLALSVVLIVLVSAESWGLSRPGTEHHLGSALGMAIVVANSLVVFGLCMLGLKMTLGRLSLGSASYVPDMFKAPPVDILETTSIRLAEPAKIVDVLNGMEP